MSVPMPLTIDELSDVVTNYKETEITYLRPPASAELEKTVKMVLTQTNENMKIFLETIFFFNFNLSLVDWVGLGFSDV